MIRLGNSLRLTSDEALRLQRVTGEDPVSIRCVAELEAYFARHIAAYPGASVAEDVLRLVIARERLTLLDATYSAQRRALR